MFDRIGIDCHVESAVDTPVALFVTVDVEPAHHHPISQRFLEDPRRYRLTLIRHLLDPGYVHRKQLHDGILRFIRQREFFAPLITALSAGFDKFGIRDR